MTAQHTLLEAFAFLVLVGCSPSDSGSAAGRGGGTAATGGASAGVTAGAGDDSVAVSTGGDLAINATGGGSAAPSVGGDAAVNAAAGASARASLGGDGAGLGGSVGTGGSTESPATGGTPSTGGSVATGGVYVPATGGVIDYAATIPADALTAEEPVCGVQQFELETQPSEVLLLLDRSTSMSRSLAGSAVTRWEAIVPTVASVVEATSSSIWWGLKTFPEGIDLGMCDPASIVPTIHVPIAEDNAAAVVAAIDASGPDGGGTPTGDTVGFALDYLMEREAISSNPKYILLATDGEPTCPQGGDRGAGAVSTVALDLALEQISAALTAGYPTFVLGVDTTSANTIENLNAMAVAGGRPQVGGTESFYLASTQAEIEAALQAIAGEIASCVFDLEPPPPVPDNIAVDFSGSRVEQDPTRTDGWDYTADDYTQLEVFGSWCERIQSEAMNRVNITYGCPGVPIPLPE
ncbi:MAG: VWA domain-containing protein [Polyangiaceae bacterium]|nr:VWA domain-containing protein [Polyangiaceae bacterium]